MIVSLKSINLLVFMVDSKFLLGHLFTDILYVLRLIVITCVLSCIHNLLTKVCGHRLELYEKLTHYSGRDARTLNK